LHRLKGELLNSAGEHEAAEQCLVDALSIARRQNAKIWELRAALDLSRLWFKQGRIKPAGDLLRPVHAWFNEGFDTPDLQRAKGASRHIELSNSRRSGK
jgi:predicted ATPase